MVEDEADIAHLKASDLKRHDRTLDIIHAYDPLEARARLLSEQFDVVVSDLSFRKQRDAFDARVKARKVSATKDIEFLLSGLSVLSDAKRHTSRPGTQGADRVRPGLVVWTIMDENRTLQVFYAHEKLGVRSFCSKSAPAGPVKSDDSTGTLLAAIRKAYDNREYSDAVIRPCLPDNQSIHDTIFKDPKWYGVWRMYALGISKEQSIIKSLNLRAKRINGYATDMYDQLVNLHSLSYRDSSPSNVLFGYAQRHWEFFLDDTVMRRYPPEAHPWAEYRGTTDD